MFFIPPKNNLSTSLGITLAYANTARLVFLCAHLAVWALCDVSLIRSGRAGVPVLLAVVAWALRELLAPALWVYACTGSTINWRGNMLSIARGGALHSKQL
jgi:hypothetical protein